MTFKARHVMSKGLISVEPTTPFREIVSTLQEHGISGVPVIAPQGTLVGIVTEADLMLKEQGTPGLRVHPLSLTLDHPSEELTRKAAGAVARDLMTSPVLTADEDTTLREIARAMSLNRIKRVVITSHDEPVGMVTRADVLKVYLRPDEEIRAEIVDTILPTGFGVVQVTVNDGVVALNGCVYRRSLAEFLARCVERVEGVVHVRNQVSHESED